VLDIFPVGVNARLQWPATPAGWLLEATGGLAAPSWGAITGPRTNAGGWLQRDEPTNASPARFYRLRRTW
jgi:hypothetical protein